MRKVTVEDYKNAGLGKTLLAISVCLFAELFAYKAGDKIYSEITEVDLEEGKVKYQVPAMITCISVGALIGTIGSKIATKIIFSK